MRKHREAVCFRTGKGERMQQAGNTEPIAA